MNRVTHAGYSVDLSQAENRIVAYVGNVLPMIEAFESNRDVHKLTAGLILNKPVEAVSDVKGSSSIGDGTKSERDWGKKANHSLNYDIGPVTFSLDHEISIVQAKWIISRYHASYPQIRKGFHALIKQQLAYNKTITNLMGRKTSFKGLPLNDDTYKAAYACLPQGTVGDIINRQGLNYIYYNDEFKHVKLMLQVHDEIVFQIPLSLGWSEHSRLLKLIKRSLEIPLHTGKRTFVIPAEFKIFKQVKNGRKIPTLEPAELEAEFGQLVDKPVQYEKFFKEIGVAL